jgi:hypothetical protein
MARYSFSEDERDTYANEKGKIIRSDNLHFDVVIVDGRRYVRNLVKNGEEQMLDHKPFTSDYPADDRFIPTRDNLPSSLGTAFENKIVGHEAVDGRDCILLDSKPRDVIKPDMQFHVRLWIDATTRNVLRYSWERVNDQPAPGLPGIMHMKGDRATFDYTVIDDVPLPAREVETGGTRSSAGSVSFTSTRIYSKYERFRAEMKIGPAAVIPPPRT